MAREGFCKISVHREVFKSFCRGSTSIDVVERLGSIRVSSRVLQKKRYLEGSVKAL